jgi:uncharacterized protein (TIGR02118 family)
VSHHSSLALSLVVRERASLEPTHEDVAWRRAIVLANGGGARIRERIVRDGPMIKLTFAVRRRDEVPPEEFHRYWRDEHGPLVRSFQSALGFRRYVQVHRIDAPANASLRASRGAAEPYDGTAEVWWDDVDEFLTHAVTPEGRAAATTLAEDEARFIDLARSSLWLGEEIEIANDGSSALGA